MCQALNTHLSLGVRTPNFPHQAPRPGAVRPGSAGLAGHRPEVHAAGWNGLPVSAMSHASLPTTHTPCPIAGLPGASGVWTTVGELLLSSLLWGQINIRLDPTDLHRNLLLQRPAGGIFRDAQRYLLMLWGPHPEQQGSPEGYADLGTNLASTSPQL